MARLKRVNLRKYPLGTVCALCGKGSGLHRASNAACPYGRPGRAGTYSFSSTDFFTVKAPKIQNKKIAKALKDYEHERDLYDHVCDYANAAKLSDTEVMAEQYRKLADARFKLYSLINEEPNTTPSEKGFKI